MKKPKITTEMMDFYREQGSIGGKKSSEQMTAKERTVRAVKAAMSSTPEERRARALKAVRAREAKRKATKSK